jgi:hypothetical protein
MAEKLYFNFMQDMFNSATAKANGINNTTSDPRILTNLLNLIWYCLNPLRVWLKLPVTVECAYRCPDLNTLLKGAKTGHPEGYCADIKVNGWSQERLFYKIIDAIKLGIIEVDQLIWEKDSNCVHIGYRLGNNRHEILIRTYDSKNKKYVYTRV